MKKFFLVNMMYLSIMYIIFLLWGCNITSIDEEKIRDISYTVMEYHYLNENLRAIYDNAKLNNERLTYEDENYLYIIICYGAMNTDGYSIEIKELYETKNTIVVDTTLKGPSKEHKPSNAESYPAIVVRIEKNDKIILFK